MRSFPARALKKFLNMPSELPEFAQIEITNVCNLNCKMCVRNAIDLEIKHIDFEIFKKIVDRLKGVRTLILTGYGEPLCHGKIFDAIRYCKKNSFEVQLTSNGLLLDTDEKVMELISSGLDSISFSFESVTKTDEIVHQNLPALANMKRLLELKRTLRSNKPLVTIQTLMIKYKEKDLFDIIKWGSANRVDRINVARFDLNPFQGVERPNACEERGIFREFRNLRKRHNIRIDCIQDQLYDGPRAFLYRHLKYFLGMDKRCIRLLDFVYVNVEGYVRPCCALVHNMMGSLLERGLKEIWQSEEYAVFRKNYHRVPWCSRCDIFTLKQK